MSKPRSIFEEVGEESVKPVKAPVPGQAENRRRRNRRFISVWLLVLAAMVFAMVIVGGLTRLTDSGLSITEWKPVVGALPPMDATHWQSEFDKYRQIPQYELLNKGMTLEEFKQIYWWEWSHRQLGRFVGLVWAVGFVAFLALRMIPTGWTGKLLLVGGLGGLQGAIGWWMVSSGLTGQMVSVASYRLATHMGLAVIIMSVLLWFAMQLFRDGAELLHARRHRLAPMIKWGNVLVAVFFIQILLGALVAGIDAGRAFPTWPDMNGEFLPSNSFDYMPLWTNFFENASLVQFNHRMFGYFAAVMGVIVYVKSRNSGHRGLKAAGGMMIVLLAVQVALGIINVLTLSPLNWAILHQIVAVGLIGSALRIRFLAAYPKAEAIARG